jgi:hypothetical protein
MVFGKARRSGPAPNLPQNYSPVAQPSNIKGKPVPTTEPLLLHIWYRFIAFLQPITSVFKFLSKPFVAGWHRTMKAFKNDRWKVFGNCAIHIPPLAITVTVLALNFSSHYYQDLGAPNQSVILGAFQLAAKLHEVLIAASITLVAVNYLQYELLRGRGLSLGQVLAGFQVTSLTSLWSPGVWNKCFSQGFRTRRIQFALLVVVLATLASIVGPSSAILMLPIIGWWDIPYETSFTETSYHHINTLFFLGANESMLWPTQIALSPEDTSTNIASSPNFNCTLGNVTIPESCAGGGMPLLLAQANPRLDEGEGTPPIWNFTMPISASAATFDRVVSGIRLNQCQNVTSFAAWCFVYFTTATSISDMLQSAWSQSGLRSDQTIRYKISLSNGGLPMAPQAVSVCKMTRINVANESQWRDSLNGVQLSFPRTNGPDWTIDAAPLTNVWDSVDGFWSTWIEPPQYLADDTPSIAAASVGNSKDQYSQPGEVQVVTCSVYVSWQPVDTYIDPSLDSYIHSSSNNKFSDPTSSKDAVAFSDWSSKEGRTIQLDFNWANTFLSPNITINQLAPKMHDDYDGWQTPLGASTSILLADAMSRIEMGNLILAVGESKQTLEEESMQVASLESGGLRVEDLASVDLNNATAVEIKTLRYGYSYSMSTVTRRLATGVLLAHVLIILIHTILVVGYGWRSPDLKTLTDLLMLVIDSSPLKTEDEVKKYNHTVKCREVSDSRLEFVFDDSGLTEGKSRGQSEDSRMLQDRTARGDVSYRKLGSHI